jgi:tRNA A37 N6-isopentenylltransferase MiaA
LAKKQRTWFKRNSSIHWLDDRSKLEDIVDLVTTNLNN